VAELRRKIQPHGLVDQVGKTVTDLQHQQRPKQIVHSSHPLSETKEQQAISKDETVSSS
jgi:hypothetical protein